MSLSSRILFWAKGFSIFLVLFRIQNFEHLIRAGLVFVDDTVAGIIDTVIASVRRLLDEHIIIPVDPWSQQKGREGLCLGVGSQLNQFFHAGNRLELCQKRPEAPGEWLRLFLHA